MDTIIDNMLRFPLLPATASEKNILDFLQMVGDTTGCDNLYVWQFYRNKENPAGALLSSRLFDWARGGEATTVDPAETPFFVNELRPGLVEALQGACCINSPVSNLPPGEQRLLAEQGVQSVCLVGIFFEGTLWGMLGLEYHRQAQTLPGPEEKALRQSAQLLGMAIQTLQENTALRGSDAFFHNVLEATGEMLWTMDSKMHFASISGRVLGVCGYEAEELANQPWETIFGSIDEQLAALSEERPTFRNVVHSLKRKDGRPCYVQTAAKAFFDTSGKVFWLMGSSMDVTKSRNIEEKLRTANEQRDFVNRQLAEAVATANQMAVEAQMASAAKSEFLANMSHEIRTPMSAILGMIHLVLKTELKTGQRDYLEKAQQAAQSLLRIINDILDFSKIEAGKMELEKAEFSLESVLRGATDMITEKASRKGVEVIVSIAPDASPYLVGDQLRLAQVLINLANNAIKFTEKGEVALSVSVEKKEDSRIMLLFSVRDTGIGMTREQMNKVFSPFSQADTSTTRRYGGTGLGLALCKNIVVLLGGNLWCESEIGQGSAFHFTAYFDMPRGRSASSEGFFSKKLKDLRILAVDDNDTALMIMAGLLLDLGCSSVRQASSGKEAIEILTSSGPNAFDILLLDWKMPEMDGVETLRQIRKIMPDESLAIVMTTAYDQSELSALLEPGEVAAIITKPFTPSLLLNAIQEAFAGDMEKVVLQSRSASPQDSIKGVNILLTEDNELNQLVASEILGQAGATVTIANNGKEALEILGSSARFDLVLMDIQMPVMDGFTAVKHIRKDPRFESLPVIAMTAHAMVGDKEKSLRGGMNDHVTKPINPDELFAVISKWCSAKRNYGGRAIAPDKDPLAGLEEVLNLDVALGRVGGNRGLFLKILLKTRDEVGARLATLRQQKEAEDLEGMAGTLSSLGNLLGSIGAQRAQAMAKALENSLSEEIPEDALNRLEATWKTVAIILQGLGK